MPARSGQFFILPAVFVVFILVAAAAVTATSLHYVSQRDSTLQIGGVVSSLQGIVGSALGLLNATVLANPALSQPAFADAISRTTRILRYSDLSIEIQQPVAAPTYVLGALNANTQATTPGYTSASVRFIITGPDIRIAHIATFELRMELECTASPCATPTPLANFVSVTVRVRATVNGQPHAYAQFSFPTEQQTDANIVDLQNLKDGTYLLNLVVRKGSTIRLDAQTGRSVIASISISA